jgi:hypothetical protein
MPWSCSPCGAAGCSQTSPAACSAALARVSTRAQPDDHPAGLSFHARQRADGAAFALGRLIGWQMRIVYVPPRELDRARKELRTSVRRSRRTSDPGGPCSVAAGAAPRKTRLRQVLGEDVDRPAVCSDDLVVECRHVIVAVEEADDQHARGAEEPAELGENAVEFRWRQMNRRVPLRMPATEWSGASSSVIEPSRNSGPGWIARAWAMNSGTMSMPVTSVPSEYR